MKTAKRILSVFLALLLILCTVSLGASAKGVSAGDTIEFGSYPQSKVSAVTAIALSLTVNSKAWTTCGYYYGGDSGITNEKVIMKYADVEYDGNLYRGIDIISFRPYNSNDVSNSKDKSYQDDNGYSTGTYWFKYEPVKWTVVNTNGLLIAENVLDAQCFNNVMYVKNNGGWKDAEGKKPANVYNESDIRAFLAENFYVTAFSEAEKKCLSSDLFNLNGSDPISLASVSFFEDYCGLFNPASSKAVPTDYAKSQGVRVEGGNTSYFLKDAGKNSAVSCMVTASGSKTDNADSVWASAGVRPVIKLKSLKSYTLKYDVNGGIGSVEDEKSFGLDEFTVTAYTPRKEGHDFLGWATDAKASAAKYKANEKLTVKDETTTLYAVWAPKSYTVIFDANGGSCSTKNKTVTYGKTYGDLPTPTRNGYFFNGWYKRTLFSKTEITAETAFSETENVTLTAEWAQAKKVTYYGNGGEDTVTNVPAAQIDNVRYTVPSKIPQRIGYNFIGWAKSAGASKADYKPGDKIPGLIGKLEDDMELYAIWEMIDASIEIRTPSITTIKYGDSLVLHADIGGTLPADAEIAWTADNPEIFDMSANGETCTLTPKKSGTAEFKASIVDKEGKTLYSYFGPTELTDTQKVESKAGFFQKFAAFFKKIFKATKIYDR